MSGANEPWPILGLRNRDGEWEEGPFDPNNLEHVAMMMELTCDCPECRAWLDTVLPGSGRRHRARHQVNNSRQRNRRRRWRQAIGKRGR